MVSVPWERREVLLFELAEQRFALPVGDILELTRACALQALPDAPPPILGVLNLRGRVVPVLDLRRRFEMPESALDPSQYFVLTQVAERVLALRVDRLIDIEWLNAVPTSEAENLPRNLRYLSGVAPVADGVVLIYDVQKFLDQAEFSQLAQALSANQPAREGAR